VKISLSYAIFDVGTLSVFMFTDIFLISQKFSMKKTWQQLFKESLTKTWDQRYLDLTKLEKFFYWSTMILVLLLIVFL
jgi:cell division protein FtsL